MIRVLIIGCGNPLRGDDGVAWRATQDLCHCGLPSDVEVLTQHQLTPELAFAVSQAETVLFLDAASEGEAGEIRCIPIEPKRGGRTFSHDLLPGNILALSEELYGRSARSFLISLCGKEFGHSETLSEPVTNSLPRFTALVANVARNASVQDDSKSSHG